MATSFGALCTDFYVNQKLALKMDLPSDRETILHMFDRVRVDLPSMDRFHRYSGELSLESNREEGEYCWLALRRQSIRSGHVNPSSLEEAYRLHRLILGTSPYHLTISSLDVDYLELLFGFDLECKANHNDIVYDALIADTPLAALIDYDGSEAIDIQPFFGISLSDDCETQAFFEVKTRTTASHIRSRSFRTEPISIYLTVRRFGPIEKPEELLEWFDRLKDYAEQLAHEKVVPNLLTPISRAITTTP